MKEIKEREKKKKESVFFDYIGTYPYVGALPHHPHTVSNHNTSNNHY